MQGERECIATIEGSNLVVGDVQSSGEVADAFQERTESDKRALEASGVSDDVGKNVFGDEKTPSVEKVEREDSDIVVGTPITGAKSEKVKDASLGESEHEKLEDVVEKASEYPVGLDTNVKPSKMGESENEKQDASGDIKENVTEDEQTTIALSMMLGEKEDNGSIEGGPLVEIDKESSEKMDDVLMGETEVNKSEVGGEDGSGGVKNDVTEDDQSIPAAQEEIEDSKKENDETVIEAEQRTNVIPLVQGEAETINEKFQQAKVSHEVDNDHETTRKEVELVPGDVEKSATRDDSNELIAEMSHSSEEVKEEENEKIIIL